MKVLKFLYSKLLAVFGVSFFKFALVGFGGMLTNLAIFYIFVDILKLWENAIAVIAFLIAGTQNYILHHLWTFRESTAGKKLSILSWVKFNLAASAGLGISLIVMNLILYFFSVPLKVIAQGCGVFAGTIVNYLASKYFIFNKKETEDKDLKPDKDPL
ncbi:MAG: GtrA family protein [Spirochaetales bacterium]|nr:GtrA family protein [Spirochaetales bacterium]